MTEPATTTPGSVVVGVDGSDGSRAALEYAMDEADRRGTTVRALMAYGGPDVWTTADGVLPDARVLHDAAAQEVRAVVEEVAASRRARGAPVPVTEADIAMGPASTVLLHHSRGAAALVVGHRGRGGLASRFIGSVGLSAVIHAECTVVVVRD
jgi:nucleotide-binding universal stress UspA family protein